MPYKDPVKAREHSRMRTKRWRERHKDQAAASRKRHYDAHRDELRAKARAWYWANRERAQVKARAYQLRSRYGLTREEVDALGDVCAICEQTPRGNGKNGRLHVDHDKHSRKVRAMLCSLCNCGLGYFRHDIAVMQKAVQYLIQHGASPT